MIRGYVQPVMPVVFLLAYVAEEEFSLLVAPLVNLKFVFARERFSTLATLIRLLHRVFRPDVPLQLVIVIKSSRTVFALFVILLVVIAKLVPEQSGIQPERFSTLVALTPGMHVYTIFRIDTFRKFRFSQWMRANNFGCTFSLATAIVRISRQYSSKINGTPAGKCAIAIVRPQFSYRMRVQLT